MKTETYRVTFLVEVEKGVDVMPLVDDATNDMEAMDGVVKVIDINYYHDE